MTEELDEIVILKYWWPSTSWATTAPLCKCGSRSATKTVGRPARCSRGHFIRLLRYIERA